jgi:hypothetical protein
MLAARHKWKGRCSFRLNVPPAISNKTQLKYENKTKLPMIIPTKCCCFSFNLVLAKKGMVKQSIIKTTIETK